jgi:hypothetical protein
MSVTLLRECFDILLTSWKCSKLHFIPVHLHWQPQLYAYRHTCLFVSACKYNWIHKYLEGSWCSSVIPLEMVPSVLLHFKNGSWYAVTFQKWFPICGYILKMVSSMQLHFKTGCNMQIHIKKCFPVCSYI